MSQVLTLKLPQGASVESGQTLEAEIKGITGVKSAGVQETRGLGAAAAAITVWVARGSGKGTEDGKGSVVT